MLYGNEALSLVLFPAGFSTDTKKPTEVGSGVLAWLLIDRFCGAIRTNIPKNVEVICARYIAARRRGPTPKECFAAKVYFAYVYAP